MDCGPISVEFYNDDATKSQLDAAIFRDDRDASTNNNFVVQYSEDVAIRGAYPIRFKTFFTSYPANFVESVTPFVITILDPCDEP